jgi:carboxymethylenebutenolidase
MKHHLLLSAILLSLMMWSPIAPRAADLPPGEKEAKAVLEKSPRHGEYVDIAVPGAKTPLKAYVVYPERKDKAPVVIVIHEIFGLSDWIRSVADQLAADGFIAIAPDLLSGHGKDGGGTDSFADRGEVTNAIRGLKSPEVTADLNAIRDYGAKLPAATGKTATIGFCWGGGQSFAYAVNQPDLSAAVVYYGTSPDKDQLDKIKCPVLGLYGGNDARISSNVPKTAEEMKALGKSYTSHVFDGAGHGFLRQQDGQNGANMKATQQAWPETLQFLRENTK